jgi:hypothetical protein
MHLHQCEMLQPCQLPPQIIPQCAPPKLVVHITLCSFARASGSKGLGGGIQQTDEPKNIIIIIFITWSARPCQAREPCRWPLTKLVASKINYKTSSAGLLS